MSLSSRTRVLVVDDSVVIRKILTDLLAEDPAIEVVGTASNGVIALSKIASLRPDLVTLDIEMPEMGGLETLTNIRRTNPRLPVIIFSSLSVRGASATLDALSLGASDYVTKPANVGSVLLSMQSVREQLIPKVHALAARAAGRSLPAAASTSATSPTATAPSAAGSASTVTAGIGATTRPLAAVQVVRRAPSRVDAIVIGASTGGPNALTALWAGLGSSLPVPVFVVQHMPLPFTTLLAERLDRVGTIPTVEASDDMAVTSGRCALAPGSEHMVVRRTSAGDRIHLHDGPPENSCRPAVDPLFVSAARLYGAGLLAVVLTGMGSDGRRGAEAVRAAGGQVVVQDEASSVVWGMPGSVVNAGLADAVLPIDQIAAEISQRLAVGRSAVRAR